MVEYRVLSSAMMKDISTLKFVWNQLSRAIYYYNSRTSIPDKSDIFEAINNSNIELARKLVIGFNLM